jgi:hypothetical protein
MPREPYHEPVFRKVPIWCREKGIKRSEVMEAYSRGEIVLLKLFRDWFVEATHGERWLVTRAAGNPEAAAASPTKEA